MRREHSVVFMYPGEINIKTRSETIQSWNIHHALEKLCEIINKSIGWRSTITLTDPFLWIGEFRDGDIVLNINLGEIVTAITKLTEIATETTKTITKVLFPPASIETPDLI